MSVHKCLFLWGYVHTFHDNFRGVYDSPNVKSRAVSETSYFTGNRCVAWGGEVIQGHSGLHLNLLIPDDSLYCLIAELMTSVGMGWGGTVKLCFAKVLKFSYPLGSYGSLVGKGVPTCSQE